MSGGPISEDNRRLLAQLREQDGMGPWMDRVFLERFHGLHQKLQRLQEVQHKLQGVLTTLSSPPWYPATFIGAVQTAEGPRACVQSGNTRRLVGVAEGVDLDALVCGDDVYLSKELNVVLGRCPETPVGGGETASFERVLPDGRLVVRLREEQLLVRARPALLDAALRPGDLLRVDRDTLIARERIERGKSSHHLVEQTPEVTFEQIGGLGPQIALIQRALLVDARHAEAARRMQRRAKGGILLYGPTGTGKTMMAKALANWMAHTLGAQRSFFLNIKPASLHSMWFSKSEENYREIFRVARELGAAHPGVPVVMYWDEVDYIASRTQHTTSPAQNSVLTAFIAELDGFESRGNVVLVASTNRPDALDPAILRPGRLGDLKLEVPRPQLKAAREILACHLPSELPYAVNGHGDDLEATRQEILDAAVSRIFAPNAGPDLATLVFRDGSRRPVRMPDLVSGALLAGIAAEARDRALYRHVDTGAPLGLMLEDVDAAIAHEFDGAVSHLTATNARQHLGGLPQDMDVMSILRPTRKPARPGRFIQAA